jgi:hypothetical protein
LLAVQQTETNVSGSATATSAQVGPIQTYSPSLLFAASEQGAWYDPSDLTTMFQDTAGTTPVSATGQAVGLLLDKSKGLALGSELVTNGTFDADTNWTKGAGWTISGGVATKTTGTSSAINQTGSTVSGTSFYRVAVTVSGRTAGSLYWRLGNTTNLQIMSANGSYTFTIQAAASGSYIGLFADTSFDGTIDNISVKELPGNHAVQATAANRPIYGIHPFGGRRNLLVRTEEFENAAWNTTGSTVTANVDTAPNATLTADQINNTGTVVSSPAVALSAGVSATFSVWLRSATGANQTVNLSIAGAVNTAFVVTPVWQRFSVVWVNPSAGTWSARIGQAAQTYNIYVWGAQLEAGSTATDYQRVTDQYNVTEAGVASVSYLFFDGVNDSMSTSTITPGTDKVQVFAGVRKLGIDGVVAELSASTSVNNGAFLVYTPGNNYRFTSRGTITAIAAGGQGTPPITSVVTGLGDISGDNATLRVNGTQAAQDTNDQGTGNYLAYPLYIGARAGTSLFFSGHLYGLIARFGPNLTSILTSATEGWVASKTGVVIA